MLARENFIRQKNAKRRENSLLKMKEDLESKNKSINKKENENSKKSRRRSSVNKIGFRRSSVAHSYIPSNLINNLIKEENDSKMHKISETDELEVDGRRKSVSESAENNNNYSTGMKRFSVFSGNKRGSVSSVGVPAFSPDNNINENENEIKFATTENNKIESPSPRKSNY